MKNIRELVLSKKGAFRQTGPVQVPEWEDATVILREPSAGAWLAWQDIIKPGENEVEMPVSERAHRNLRADVVLFVDVLLDVDGQQVFTVDDIPALELVYGPVHSRLLRQALNLTTDADEAKKK